MDRRIASLEMLPMMVVASCEMLPTVCREGADEAGEHGDQGRADCRIIGAV
jgi:hypothetical protein